MTTKEILEKYLQFFKSRGHQQIPNVSLIPQNDPTLLFVNSGMFPLVPYLSGESHPLGKRLMNVQRALRTQDIDEIGDKSHTLVFHMIGNWSLGDYFKKEQLPWIYEFLFEEMHLDPRRVATTIFRGDENAPKDDESIKLITDIFSKYGITLEEGKNIFACGKKENWWQRGDAVGELGGPDSEIHYYLGEGDYASLGKDPVKDDKEFVEIGNSVFMQYQMAESGWLELPQKNMDFGGGLERLAWVVQGKKDIFETDNFWPIIEKIESLSGKKYHENQRSMRILADHARACTFLIMDGVEPGNKDQGYILRRLLRRMTRSGRTLGIEKDLSAGLVEVVVGMFTWMYPDLESKKSHIVEVFVEEETKFMKTLREGEKQVEKLIQNHPANDAPFWADAAFALYQSLGYPQEIFLEDLKEKKIFVDEVAFIQKFDNLLDEHQAGSRSGAEGKFKGGLADQGETTVKYHTTAHLVQAALQEVVGSHISQAGSNITGERMRFDFTHDDKLSDEQVEKVQNWVNEKISQKLPVTCVVMPKEDAIKAGAGYMKHETYPDHVKVYFVGEDLEKAISKELCGGPHITNTSELSPIEIFKQENIGKGKRRIYVRFK